MGKNPFGGGPPGGGKKGGRGKQSTLSSIALLTALAALVYFASVFVFNSQLDDASSKRTHQQSASSSKPPKPSATTASAKQRRYTSPGAKPPTKGGSKARRLKHESSEWTGLTRDIEACLASQDELMNVPVEWPGFHALCIDAVNAEEIRCWSTRARVIATQTATSLDRSPSTAPRPPRWSQTRSSTAR